MSSGRFLNHSKREISCSSKMATSPSRIKCHRRQRSDRGGEFGKPATVLLPGAANEADIRVVFISHHAPTVVFLLKDPTLAVERLSDLVGLHEDDGRKVRHRLSIPSGTARVGWSRCLYLSGRICATFGIFQISLQSILCLDGVPTQWLVIS
jgi:hypothetical protein